MIYDTYSCRLWWNNIKREKSTFHAVLKLQKVPYITSVGHDSIALENPACYLRPDFKKFKLTFKLTNSPQYSENLYDS
jgi:hypothetical protein